MHTLRDIYYAEQQLVKALPKMVEKASDSGLKQAFQSFGRDQESGHAARTGLQDAGEEVKGVACPAIDGIIEEGKEIIEEDADDEVKDAALIAAAQRVEHYEIAAYGCLRTYAKVLGNKKAQALLQETLDEETAADEKLTQLAESRLNAKAA